MTKEQASLLSGRRAAAVAALLVALAVLIGAAHVLAQPEIGLPPASQPVLPKSNNRPEPLPQKLPERVLNDGLQPPAPPLPPTVAQPPVPQTTGTPPSIPPTRPPAFRIVGKDPPQPPATAHKAYSAPAPPMFPATEVVQTPVLALEVIGPAPVQPGQPVEYTIVLRNVGQTPAQQARLEDELPPSARLVGAQPAPEVQGQRLVWSVENLPPGGEQRFRVQLVLASAGEIISQATVMASATRAIRARNDGPARLVVGINGPPSVPVGHLASYEVRATNVSAAPLPRLTLGAMLPSGFEHLFGTDIETAFDGLAPGETRRVQLELVALQPGHHAIQVSAEAEGGQRATNRATVTVTEDPVLSLRWIGPREAMIETENEYRIEVTNRSQAALRGVLLSEALPPGVELLDRGRGTFDPASRTVRWQLGPLAPGETQGVTLKLLARNAGPLLNRVAARTDQGHDAQLNQVLRFRPPGQPPSGKMP